MVHYIWLSFRVTAVNNQQQQHQTSALTARQKTLLLLIPYTTVVGSTVYAMFFVVRFNTSARGRESSVRDTEKGTDRAQGTGGQGVRFSRLEKGGIL